uniref:hypothetical protein n=1 Tax=Sphingomonas sp. CFBP 13706 TaxID=2775314 RepID=UPI001FD453EB|nr:hypothetical protein [Sphingomonas sp. CFBP 13706]
MVDEHQHQPRDVMRLLYCPMNLFGRRLATMCCVVAESAQSVKSGDRRLRKRPGKQIGFHQIEKCRSCPRQRKLPLTIELFDEMFDEQAQLNGRNDRLRDRVPIGECASGSQCRPALAQR